MKTILTVKKLVTFKLLLFKDTGKIIKLEVLSYLPWVIEKILNFREYHLVKKKIFVITV